MHTEDYGQQQKSFGIFLCLIPIIARFLLSHLFSFLPGKMTDGVLSSLLSSFLNAVSWFLPFGIFGYFFTPKLVRKTKSNPKEVLLLFFAVYFLATVLSMPYTAILELFGYKIPSVDISEYGVAQMMVFVFSSVILVPLSEEFAFRKIILGNLLPSGRFPAIMISAVLFAMCHDPSSYVYSFIFGFVLAVVVIYHGFEFSVICHAANNAISCIYMILARYISPAAYNAVFLMKIVVVIFAGVYCMIKIVKKR